MNVLRLITDFIKMSKVWFLSMEFYGVWQEGCSIAAANAEVKRVIETEENSDGRKEAIMRSFLLN